eukprot:CAMPEP_0119267186 /NCGR_PEP_ID=MMETSP1329-20130426/5428_1 /TAXON_ID=114041 /ORGANISM="Genus nov. species nov., Strain RCC1024" /LENGTH=176 /DNA_ID=CAMNT_0007267101 /DNA_START=121 /DNA_END=647 /DNA_ORIENTATION=-
MTTAFMLLASTAAALMPPFKAKTTAPARAYDKARLLWSPGVAKATALNYAGIALAAAALKRTPAAALVEAAAEAVREALLRSAHRAGWWAALSLLSSSCCVVQLALNLASVGCAGFNTWLGPTRPFFLALAIHARWLLREAARASTFSDPAVRRYNAVGGALALVVALAPEAVALV